MTTSMKVQYIQTDQTFTILIIINKANKSKNTTKLPNIYWLITNIPLTCKLA